MENWYRAYGNLISLPQKANFSEYPDCCNPQGKTTPSPEQLESINGALTLPLTYIWGAPGTGKTQFVLARCILAYMSQSNCKILITAPTNNAVEQMLLGILPVLEEFKIPIERVLRLGIPSRSFSYKYPQVCESFNTEKKLNKITQLIAEKKSEIQTIENYIVLFPKYKIYVEFQNRLNKCESELPVIMNDISEEYKRKIEAGEQIDINNGKIKRAEIELNNLKREKSLLSVKIKEHTHKVSKYEKGILKIFFKNRLKKLADELNKFLNSLQILDEKIASETSVINECREDNKNLNDFIWNTITIIQSNIQKLNSITDFYKGLNVLVNNITDINFNDKTKALKLEIDSLKRRLAKKSKTYDVFTTLDEENLKKQKSALEIELQDLLDRQEQVAADSSSSRIAKCRVLAATVDTCISRVLPNGDFKPAHIFLDEAGYCSLIKGAVLLAYQCPVTLLGDHMQLPPICEMNDNYFNGECESVVIWAQSSLYIEDIFCDNPIGKILSSYIKNTSAAFRELKRFELNHTYRFGQSLADVLAKNVYTQNFCGNENHDTEIYYIYSPKTDSDKPHTSISECNNIKKYILSYPTENIAVITPYKNQKELLLKELNKIIDATDCLLTVHGSQGREWDSVLFSIAETTKNWFISNSNGIKIINTAVSRAKKKLIIVCDSKYWLSNHNHLIGQILSTAKEIKFTDFSES